MVFQYWKEGSYFDGVAIGMPSVNMARLITCFLLHLELLPELSSAKSMFDFARKNPSSFHGQSFEYACLFAVFKLTGGLLCLFANLTVLVRSDNIEDVVKDYVAVAIISSIDNQMASTFKEPNFPIDLNLYMSLQRDRLTDVQLLNEYVLE